MLEDQNCSIQSIKSAIRFTEEPEAQLNNQDENVKSLTIEDIFHQSFLKPEPEVKSKSKVKKRKEISGAEALLIVDS